MDKRPLVSVIVPCYKSTNFIDRLVDSVIHQTYENWELVLVDDCSPDNTWDVLQNIAKQDSRIHVFRSNKNNGRAAPTLNIAIKHAHGDFIQILGHDDALSYDCLEKCVKRYNETGADIILPDAEFVFPENPSKNYIMAGVLKNGKTEKIIDRSVILTGQQALLKSLDWSIHAWGFFNADIIKKHMFCETGMNGDEYSAREFFLSANSVAFCDGKYLYYQVENSITKKISTKLFDVYDAPRRVEELLIKNNFPKHVIRKQNRMRFDIYCHLVNMLKKYSNQLSESDLNICIKHLEKCKSDLYVYKTFRDYIFRKEKWGTERILVFFNLIKIKYKK